MDATAVRKQEIFAKAVDYIARSYNAQPPALIVGLDGRPLAPSGGYAYRKAAAKRTGSMKNWIPTRYYGPNEESRERRQIVERSIDLINSDPNAAGIADTYATTVVGAGLTPHPLLDSEALGLSKDETRIIQKRQLSIYHVWQSQADASQRLNFGAIQYLLVHNMIQYGEYLMLLPMLADPSRKYSLACQIINPLRLATPTDLATRSDIIDGVEVGSYGEPVAYWIQKSARELGRGTFSALAVTSKDYLRVPAKTGHRWNVLHGFAARDAEQYRGTPMFAPAMKFFRDLNDYLDAELVSNIVTAAYSIFIEVGTGTNPIFPADMALSLSGNKPDTTNQVRYQELIPGQIMYGNQGEKPIPIFAARPGATFEPFTKVIKKAISMAINIPYAVLFKDPEATNFAGFRSAMLDAWRVFMTKRVWLGHDCRKVWTMLQEEAYLRGDIQLKDYYTNEALLTRTEWRGAPKGDIEPIKANQADVLLVQNNLKTRTAAAAERGDDWRAIVDQLAEEQEMLIERGLGEKPLNNPPLSYPDKTLDETGEENELSSS